LNNGVERMLHSIGFINQPEFHPCHFVQRLIEDAFDPIQPDLLEQLATMTLIQVG
jgi:hypothetical protein